MRAVAAGGDRLVRQCCHCARITRSLCRAGSHQGGREDPSYERQTGPGRVALHDPPTVPVLPVEADARAGVIVVDITGCRLAGPWS